MGMESCPDCGNEVSQNAFSCPHCGRWFGIFHGTLLDGQRLGKDKKEKPKDGEPKNFWDQFKSFDHHNFKGDK